MILLRRSKQTQPTNGIKYNQSHRWIWPYWNKNEAGAGILEIMIFGVRWSDKLSHEKHSQYRRTLFRRSKLTQPINGIKYNQSNRWIWRWEKPQEGGVELCFWKLLLLRSRKLFSGSESEVVQSLSEFRVYVQQIK